LFPQSRQWLCCGRFSPDDAWIIFWDGTLGRSYIARFQDESPLEESGWIAMGGNGGWSPDGQLVFYGSSQDGYLCIWAQRLDPATKRPIAQPFAVFHSHNARISLANQNDWTLAIGPDKMLFNMGELTGNIWMAEWKQQ